MSFIILGRLFLNRLRRHETHRTPFIYDPVNCRPAHTRVLRWCTPTLPPLSDLSGRRTHATEHTSLPPTVHGVFFCTFTLSSTVSPQQASPFASVDTDARCARTHTSDTGAFPAMSSDSDRASRSSRSNRSRANSLDYHRMSALVTTRERSGSHSSSLGSRRGSFSRGSPHRDRASPRLIRMSPSTLSLRARTHLFIFSFCRSPVSGQPCLRQLACVASVVLLHNKAVPVCAHPCGWPLRASLVPEQHGAAAHAGRRAGEAGQVDQPGRDHDTA